MSAAAVEPGLTPRRRAWIAGFWAAAALVLLVHWLWLGWIDGAVRVAAGADGEGLIPSPRWRVWGYFAPLFLVTVAILAQHRWAEGAWRGIARVGLFAAVPAYFLTLSTCSLALPLEVGSAALRDGRRLILAIEPAAGERVYALYEPADPLGLYWRRLARPDAADDGRFVGGEALELSRDGTALLVARGGLWTACLRVAGPDLVDCAIPPRPSGAGADHERAMRLRSGRIAALGGRPPPRL